MDVVIGALSYTGRSIARRLVAAGGEVHTLTGHPGRVNPFGHRVAVAALQFEDTGALVERVAWRGRLVQHVLGPILSRASHVPASCGKHQDTRGSG